MSIVQGANELGGWFHDLSPYVWRISGDFGIRWYGVSYLLAFVLAYVMLRMLAKRGVTPIPKDRIADSMMLLVGGVIVGGRLGYVTNQPLHQSKFRLGHEKFRASRVFLDIKGKYRHFCIDQQ